MLCDWLQSVTRRPHDAHPADEPERRLLGRKPKRADRRAALSSG
jgi:hypothetical protein